MKCLTSWVAIPPEDFSPAGIIDMVYFGHTQNVGVNLCFLCDVFLKIVASFRQQSKPYQDSFNEVSRKVFQVIQPIY